MGIVHRLRVLLASRKLFSNWLSAGIKYYWLKAVFFVLAILRLFAEMVLEV